MDVPVLLLDESSRAVATETPFPLAGTPAQSTSVAGHSIEGAK